ncbi:hypothetical protein [Nocardia crassostreae]|uniref:hypothetical protein n=1 Tax=Nocardia crassostreae TaxID=53428 RepID=UPI0008309B94|nr:hypothetical protein [Nocardia crassostreae]
MLKSPDLARSLRNLVQDIRALGIAIPNDLDEEIKLVRQLGDEERTAIQAIQAKQAQLRTVAAKDYTQTRGELIELLNLETARRDNDFRQFENDTVANRIARSMAQAADDFQSGLADVFNQVVADHRLNESAADLPKFADRHLSVLNLTTAQHNAVEAWKLGAEALRPIWGAFARLGTFLGYELGASSEYSAQLDNAYVLGDVTEPQQAHRMAQYFNSLWHGTDSHKPLQPLMPFVYAAYAGVPLRLKTLDVAAELRRQIQAA